MLHIKHLLEYGMECEARELDFTKGEEQYKYRFANHARLNYAARVHPASMFYGVDRFLPYAKAAVGRSRTLSRLSRRLLKPWIRDTLQRLGL